MQTLQRQNASAVSAKVSWVASKGFNLSFIPIQIALLGRVASHWQVIQPLVVTIERSEDGSFLASDEVFAMYGEGDSLGEAIQDYVAALIEYYGILAAHDDEPSVALFHYLLEYLQPIGR